MCYRAARQSRRSLHPAGLLEALETGQAAAHDLLEVIAHLVHGIGRLVRRGLGLSRGRERGVLQQRFEELGTPERVGEGHVTPRSLLLPDELLGPLAVRVVLALDPVDLLEHLGPLAPLADPDLALHGETELAVGVERPEGVDRLEIRHREGPHLGEVDPAAVLGVLARELDHQTAVFVVSLLPLASLETIAEGGVVDASLGIEAGLLHLGGGRGLLGVGGDGGERDAASRARGSRGASADARTLASPEGDAVGFGGHGDRGAGRRAVGGARGLGAGAGRATGDEGCGDGRHRSNRYLVPRLWQEEGPSGA
mmetsp:Transcript_12635/g.57375  ORF Transcript_12635/g.57375 Transcript_12635/m.57375 type:complete len:311 (+) Transcript_12635:78-1010(+)